MMAELCPHGCGLTVDTCERCVGGPEIRHDAYRRSLCQARTIVNLRAQLAAREADAAIVWADVQRLERELAAAEKLNAAVVDAADGVVSHPTSKTYRALRDALIALRAEANRG